MIEAVKTIINMLYTTTLSKCPYCSSASIIKYGKSNIGRQRYRCKQCKKCFSQFTSSPMSYSKKPIESWANYIVLLNQKATLDEGAKASKLCLTTSFYWRHKLLASLTPENSNQRFSKVLQINELILPINNKGNHKNKNIKWRRPRWILNKFVPSVKLFSCVDSAYHRDIIPVAERIDIPNIRRYLMPRVTEGTIIATMNPGRYNISANYKKVIAKRYAFGVDTNKISDECPKENLALKQSDNFKKFIRKMNGISTKYLSFYSKWFMWIQYSGCKENMFLKAIMKNRYKIRFFEISKVNLRGEIVGI